MLVAITVSRHASSIASCDSGLRERVLARSTLLVIPESEPASWVREEEAVAS